MDRPIATPAVDSIAPHDARCHGVQCAAAHHCRRYLARRDMAPHTPIANKLCRAFSLECYWPTTTDLPTE